MSTGVAVAGPVGPVGVAAIDLVGVAVADPVGVAVADPVAVAVAEAVAVDVAGAATTSFVTVAVQITSAPPPLPEPLHWSTFTGSVAVIVDAPVTVHV